jgi:hypothetical protein
MHNQIDIRRIKNFFEEDLLNAPFKLDLSIDSFGRYTNKETFDCFQQYASGYFDGYTENDKNIDQPIQ